MNDRRRAELRKLRDAVDGALVDGRGVETVARACRMCVEMLPVDGVSVSIMTDTQNRELLYVSDALIDTVENLQFSLGEGPCFEAFHHGRPVLVPDLADVRVTEWPVFASTIRKHPIGAVFALPIGIGVIRIGALDMYRSTAGSLSPDELATALKVVDIIGLALLGRSGDGAHGDGSGVDRVVMAAPGDHVEVHQATGMLLSALGMPAEEAFARLRAYAFSHDRFIGDVAHDIVTRELRPGDIGP